MKLKLIIRYSFIVLAVFFMAVIFYFSSQTGEKSYSVSQNVSQNIGTAINANTGGNAGIKEFILSYIRKFAHVFLYAGLGLSVSVAAFTFSFKHKWLWLLIPVVICFAYAASDEFHQLFVDGRGASFSDVMIDSIGFLASILISNLLWFLIILYKKKKNSRFLAIWL